MNGSPPVPAHPWHVLFAPLPPDTVPRRKPVAPPEITSTPDGASIAGWEDLIVELSEPLAGSRVLSVVLDATGTPIAASDMVLYRRVLSDAGEGGPLMVEYRTESVGGRLETDGSFRGTRWSNRSVQDERRDSDDEAPWHMEKAVPSEEDAARLKALVAEMLRRAPPRAPF